MFNFFKKEKNVEKRIQLHSPVDGNIIPIEEVNEQVFSSKMMGDGFAVIPKNGEVYSPVKGQVTSIFPTKHAFGIITEEGLEVLIHIGIDTVELDGEPFELYIKEGDKVDVQTKIAEVNLQFLYEKEKEKDIIVIFTNMNQINKYSLTKIGSINSKEIVGNIELIWK